MIRSSILLFSLLPIIDAFGVQRPQNQRVVTQLFSEKDPNSPNLFFSDAEGEEDELVASKLDEEALVEELEEQASELWDMTEEVAPSSLLNVEEFKEKAGTFTQKAQAFLGDNKAVKEMSAKVQSLFDSGEIKGEAQTVESMAKAFSEDEKIQKMSTRVQDLATTAKAKTENFLKDEKVKDVFAQAQEILNTIWTKLTETLESTLGQKLRELKAKKEKEE